MVAVAGQKPEYKSGKWPPLFAWHWHQLDARELFRAELQYLCRLRCVFRRIN